MSSISAYKEGRTIKQDHVIKKEEFEERILTWLMFEASRSKEDGSTSFWTFLVVTLLALTWAQGAAAWGIRFRFEDDFDESGWLSNMIFDMGGAFLQKRTTGAAGRLEKERSSYSCSGSSCCCKRDKQFRENLNKRS
jgi:hypothetical protein